MATSDERIALAERIEAIRERWSLRNSDYEAITIAARLLRESAQREAELQIKADAGKSWHDAEAALRLRAITAERANRDERAIWSRVMERLTGNGTYATSEIESAIAKAEADAFKRGLEAALEKVSAERAKLQGRWSLDSAYLAQAEDAPTPPRPLRRPRPPPARARSAGDARVRGAYAVILLRVPPAEWSALRRGARVRHPSGEAMIQRDLPTAVVGPYHRFETWKREHPSEPCVWIGREESARGIEVSRVVMVGIDQPDWHRIYGEAYDYVLTRVRTTHQGKP